jgi:murein tripeptide amidase MpaA
MIMISVALISSAQTSVAWSLSLLTQFSKTNHRPFTRQLSRKSLQAVSISDAFDGGNIEYISQDQNNEESGAVTRVHLNIKKDPFTALEQKHHFQYFCFRSVTDKGERVRYVIENAHEASYATAWHDFTVFSSPTLSNPDSWTRVVSTSYEDGKLSWKYTGPAYFCYFPPYSYNRHLDLISRCHSATGVADVFTLGKTLDMRELDCVKLGTGEEICWIIHRQHPGEPMAEYYAEGLLERLLSADDNVSRRALQLYTLYIVPNMNPDGSGCGHLRTNAHGHNLNREWASSPEYPAPTVERSPEVYHVLEKMKETGVDAFLDVHGDEELPYNFLAGSEGVPNWGPRLQSLHGAFLASYQRANSDMQAVYAYDPDESGKAKLNICSNQIAAQFDCFAATLEMPFKDCLSNSDPTRGWSPARARQLGASVVDALCYIHPHLHADTWIDLPPEDAYIRPMSKYKDS